MMTSYKLSHMFRDIKRSMLIYSDKAGNTHMKHII